MECRAEHAGVVRYWRKSGHTEAQGVSFGSSIHLILNGNEVLRILRLLVRQTDSVVHSLLVPNVFHGNVCMYGYAHVCITVCVRFSLYDLVTVFFVVEHCYCYCYYLREGGTHR